MKSNIQLIEKKQIKFLKFPENDVFSEKSEKINRFVALHRALYLGNIEQGKVKIVFSDDTNLKRVETTISGVTNKAVILKKHTTIPLSRIVSVA